MSGYKSAQKRFNKTEFQFMCKQCTDVNPWWDDDLTSSCDKCGVLCEKLPFNKMIGIGWFRCRRCPNLFAGFCRGNFKSPCFKCGRYVKADIIVDGKRARNPKKSSGSRHLCELCISDHECPVVAAARRCRRRARNQTKQ